MLSKDIFKQMTFQAKDMDDSYTQFQSGIEKYLLNVANILLIPMEPLYLLSAFVLAVFCPRFFVRVLSVIFLSADCPRTKYPKPPQPTPNPQPQIPIPTPNPNPDPQTTNLLPPTTNPLPPPPQPPESHLILYKGYF